MTKTKKRNPQDLTLRNLRALKKSVKLTQAMFRFTDECYERLAARLSALERDLNNLKKSWQTGTAGRAKGRGEK